MAGSDDRAYPAMRRKDRARDDTWIRQFIATAPFGTTAVLREGAPYPVTNTFVYDPDTHAIYFHSAPTGTLVTAVRDTPGSRCAFTAASMGRLLPAEIAAEFSVEFASVVAFGRIRVVDDLTERRHAMAQLNHKYFPHLVEGEDYLPVTDNDLSRIAVYRLDIDYWTGKKKEAEPDFPGAFTFGSPPDRPTGSSA
ncbi:hypothetical protein GF420_00765 [candidate division GN15 bacterium]|nr:hypothetical protein [candidate division GN15 bacterium]